MNFYPQDPDFGCEYTMTFSFSDLKSGDGDYFVVGNCRLIEEDGWLKCGLIGFEEKVYPLRTAGQRLSFDFAGDERALTLWHKGYPLFAAPNGQIFSGITNSNTGDNSFSVYAKKPNTPSYYDENLGEYGSIVIQNNGGYNIEVNNAYWVGGFSEFESGYPSVIPAMGEAVFPLKVLGNGSFSGEYYFNVETNVGDITGSADILYEWAQTGEDFNFHIEGMPAQWDTVSEIYFEIESPFSNDGEYEIIFSGDYLTGDFTGSQSYFSYFWDIALYNDGGGEVHIPVFNASSGMSYKMSDILIEGGETKSGIIRFENPDYPDKFNPAGILSISNDYVTKNTYINVV